MPERIVRTQAEGHLAWLDLEMTGLDASEDVILQAGLVLTDRHLVPLEQYVCDIWQPEPNLARMTPFVRDMHEKNGLLERVRASKLDLRSAEKHLLERVAGWCAFPAVLCGNTIGQDKRFIERWMPGLAGYLHYRTVDVSSVKILVQAWYGEGAVFKKPDDREHDALIDIKNSIAELEHYRDTVFRAPA